MCTRTHVHTHTLTHSEPHKHNHPDTLIHTHTPTHTCCCSSSPASTSEECCSAAPDARFAARARHASTSPEVLRGRAEAQPLGKGNKSESSNSKCADVLVRPSICVALICPSICVALICPSICVALICPSICVARVRWASHERGRRWWPWKPHLPLATHPLQSLHSYLLLAISRPRSMLVPPFVAGAAPMLHEHRSAWLLRTHNKKEKTCSSYMHILSFVSTLCSNPLEGISAPEAA